jgi:competence protein ComEC
MTLKERKLYRSGKRNPNGYLPNPFDYFYNRRKAKIICVVIIISFIFEFLCLIGVTSWPQFLSGMNLIDSVKKQDSNFVVYYLDAGQGDCTLIICDDEVLMIDSSTTNQFYNIKKHLFSLEIDTIDYLLITHQHDDHLGSATKIINHYSVSNIMMPCLSYDNYVDSLSYDDLINAISIRNINHQSVSAGDSFVLGSAIVEILAPMKQDDNINNMSLVIKITYGNTSFLFTGDGEKEVEKQLLRANIDVSADVLRVGHHGSKTSSTDAFLTAVNPDFAIISCGMDNNYGHPNSETIKNLEVIGLYPYITSVNGDITVTSDGNRVTLISQKSSF